MIRFASDYQEGAHPLILKRLSEINLNQYPGYSEDEVCERARRLILEKCAAPNAHVHFLVGGTQTNMTLIAAALRPHQGAVAADCGHIAVHESGAVEATGHKVITLPARDGKLDASDVSEYCRLHYRDASFEHMVQPKLVYISNPTEFGTIYSKAELRALRDVCDRWNMYLYLDGARLGYGLASQKNELDLPFIAEMCDAFYIGGTKQGFLFGEALIITNNALNADFRYILKQNGGMLAKGWLLGVQFEVMFENDLYFELSGRAMVLADRLRNALIDMGIPFYIDSPTNQLFPILPNEKLKALEKDFAFSVTKVLDETHTCVRFCTSWATTEENIDRLIEALK